MKQRAQIDAQIKQARQIEAANVLQKVRALVAEFQMAPEQVFARKKTNDRAQPAKVPAKYYDPNTGNQWTGRGKPPLWIKDKDRAQYLIDARS